VLNDERHWIPAFAGMTVVFEATVIFPPSSPACDDCCVGGSHAIRSPHSLPAKGCSGGFRPHAVCPRNGDGVLAITRPAREAGVSDRMRSARGTVMAYSPLRALQGGIQYLCFIYLHQAVRRCSSLLPMSVLNSALASVLDSALWSGGWPE